MRIYATMPQQECWHKMRERRAPLTIGDVLQVRSSRTEAQAKRRAAARAMVPGAQSIWMRMASATTWTPVWGCMTRWACAMETARQMPIRMASAMTWTLVWERWMLAGCAMVLVLCTNAAARTFRLDCAIARAIHLMQWACVEEAVRATRTATGSAMWRMCQGAPTRKQRTISLMPRWTMEPVCWRRQLAPRM